MGDQELELTKQELHMLIQRSMDNQQLTPGNLKSKCKHLQSLLERKEKMSTDLRNLLESVSKCETTVKMLFTKLGWEYEESEEQNCNDDAVHDEVLPEETDNVRSSSPASNDVAAVDSVEEWSEERSKTPEMKVESPKLKELRVVLHRLPMEPKRNPPRSTSKRVISEVELSDEGSDYEPGKSTGDSDFSVSSTKREKQKKKKPLKAVIPSRTKRPPSQPASSAQSEKSEAHAKGTNAANPGQNVNPVAEPGSKPSAYTNAKQPFNIPQQLKVGLQVLAKKKKLTWDSGKITEIVKKEDGTEKFKVVFGDQVKVLVSGHHVAPHVVPKLAHLSVGCRVVAKSKVEDTFFSPGILGELPSRSNHMRFLIFFDDQKTSYVSLPVLRVVSNPLPDPLDDLRDEQLQDFLRDYLVRMPHPLIPQFKVDQQIKVERNGVFEACTVVQLDSNLMQVVYADEEKEWLYRGSFRLELFQR